jgi:outer membrane protein assembly factor BamB
MPKVVPPPPDEPAITEPVVTVHRFAGKYLGDDGRRVLLYTETGPGKAVVESRLLEDVLTLTNHSPKDEGKRAEIPAGKTARFGGRAFIATPRGLIVYSTGGEFEWRFLLPGKDDNGETLLGVAGFHDGKVYVVSRQKAQAKSDPAPGRVYAFEVESGRLAGFRTVAGGFDADAKLSVDGSNKTLVAVDPAQVTAYPLASNDDGWTLPVPSTPLTQAAAADGSVCGTTPGGVIAAHRQQVVALLDGQTGTAPPAMRLDDATAAGGHVYVPVKTAAGQFALTAVERNARGLPWTFPVAKAITVAPVLRGRSVYFVAGNVLYRVNAATGAICWKYTLPLKADDVLDELAFAGSELRASGPGLLVRVADRPEPPAAPAPAK